MGNPSGIACVSWWIALCAVGAAGSASNAEEVPFVLPVPDTWRTETIPFPLQFAPELEYTGLEELRFSPGMFDESSDQYWSYAFVWWVGAESDPGAADLRGDLEAYFRGLTRAVAQSRGFDPGEGEHRASIEEIEPDGEVRRFRGEIVTFDAFAARTPVRLTARIESWICSPEQRRVVFFRLSPQPDSAPVWDTLDEIRRGFRCRR